MSLSLSITCNNIMYRDIFSGCRFVCALSHFRTFATRRTLSNVISRTSRRRRRRRHHHHLRRHRRHRRQTTRGVGRISWSGRWPTGRFPCPTTGGGRGSTVTRAVPRRPPPWCTVLCPRPRPGWTKTRAGDAGVAVARDRRQRPQGRNTCRPAA